jgi:hypothetical protein
MKDLLDIIDRLKVAGGSDWTGLILFALVIIVGWKSIESVIPLVQSNDGAGDTGFSGQLPIQ